MGLNHPEREVRLLLSFIQKRSYEEVFLAPEVTVDDYQALEPLVKRRLQGEPLSKIMEEREFWGLRFKISHDTLDPRPDSETAIEAVLHHFPERHQPLRLVDLGVGSGCLLLSLLSEYPRAFGVGIDKSLPALKMAQQNASRLGFTSRTTFLNSHWAESLQGMFDVLISNPPYIAENEVLDISVTDYDPALALYGGQDGLQAYRELLPQVPFHMHQKSQLFLEIGKGQEAAVRQIAQGCGLRFLASYQDLGGIERVLVFQRG